MRRLRAFPCALAAISWISRQDYEQHRHRRHGADDEAVAPVVPQLLAEDRRQTRAELKLIAPSASTSSSTSSR